MRRSGTSRDLPSSTEHEKTTGNICRDVGQIAAVLRQGANIGKEIRGDRQGHQQDRQVHVLWVFLRSEFRPHIERATESRAPQSTNRTTQVATLWRHAIHVELGIV